MKYQYKIIGLVGRMYEKRNFYKFETEQPYIIVTLDEPCRKQQLGEGWFKSMDEVPRQAISMSIQQIMKSKHIICSAPDSRIGCELY